LQGEDCSRKGKGMNIFYKNVLGTEKRYKEISLERKTEVSLAMKQMMDEKPYTNKN